MRGLRDLVTGWQVGVCNNVQLVLWLDRRVANSGFVILAIRHDSFLSALFDFDRHWISKLR